MNTLLRGLLRHVYMAEEGAAAAGGGAATTGAEGQGQGDAGQSAQSGGGDQGSQPGAGTESGTGDTTVLAGAQSESAQAAQVQEKYLVKKEDGTTDWEATAQKQAQGYDALAKRMGSGDAPPKAVEDYQIAVPESLAGQWDPKEDAELQGFLKEAHAAGFTQKQIDLAMKSYVDVVQGLSSGIQQLNADDCVAALKETWKTDQEYSAGVSSAFKAAQGFFGNDAQHIIDRYGNDPILIRGLAKIGAEMGEDSAVNPESALTGGQTVDDLMRSEAYNNPKHADHAKVSKQVQDYYNKLAKQQEKSGQVPLM